MSSPKQRHAVRERCSALRRSLEQFETTFLDESDESVRGRAERHEIVNQGLERILTQANHLRKALTFAAPNAIDPDLADRIRNLRNIHEHWEQNYSAFLDEGTEKRGSARWFAKRYPDKSPLSYGWSKVGGFEIGGIINLRELHDLIEQAEAMVNAGSR